MAHMISWPVEVPITKYSRWYDKLISVAKSRTLPADTYTEMHHVIPRSFGGSDDRSNLVRLTAREHYIAHALLWRMGFPGKYHIAMSAAFRMMIFGGKLDVDKRNSRLYESIRKEWSIHHSDRMTGVNNPYYGKKHSPEIIEKMKKKQAEISTRISRTASHMHNPETWNKISDAKKGVKWSDSDHEQLKKRKDAARSRIKARNDKKLNDPDYIKNLSESGKRHWDNLSPEEKQLRLDQLADMRSRVKKKPVFINPITYRGIEYQNYATASRITGKTKYKIEYEIKRWGPNPDQHTIDEIESESWKVPWNKGKTGIYSEETKRKTSATKAAKKATGWVSPMKGKPANLEAIEKAKATKAARKAAGFKNKPGPPMSEIVAKIKATKEANKAARLRKMDEDDDTTP